MKRERVLVTRVSEQEFMQLLMAAAKLDVSFSEMLRAAALALAAEVNKSE